MQPLKYKIKSFLALLLIPLICLNCNPVFAEITNKGDVQNSQKTLNLSGLYLGFYPCSDCQGIRTTLALNNNNSYVYISLYAGKSDREFVEKGKFSLDKDGNTLVLTPGKSI